jgi:PilZ domain
MRVPGWVEREQREPVSFGASIVLPDGRSVPVTIRDVSANGCCVECEETLPIAEAVRLNLGDDSIEAEVRWALPGAAGLQLTNRRSEGSWFPRQR